MCLWDCEKMGQSPTWALGQISFSTEGWWKETRTYQYISISLFKAVFYVIHPVVFHTFFVWFFHQISLNSSFKGAEDELVTSLVYFMLFWTISDADIRVKFPEDNVAFQFLLIQATAGAPEKSQSLQLPWQPSHQKDTEDAAKVFPYLWRRPLHCLWSK